MIHSVQIGRYTVSGNVFLAPMAGITDLPFRVLCRNLGSSYAVGEMTTSQENLLKTEKTKKRYDFTNEPNPRTIQLIGSDPIALVSAARKGVEAGAQIVDLNCGCPAKKVCSVSCGSALLQYPDLVEELLTALTSNLDVPVTLKFRTGWKKGIINALQIAEIAQRAGVAMLVLHGRTREDGYSGEAEYETIRQVKKSVDIPVIANGDITDGPKARAVLEYTGADGVMIGRASLGNPWVFKEIITYLRDESRSTLSLSEIRDTILHHHKMHIDFYGEAKGVRTFRKHLTWYLKRFGVTPNFMATLNKIEDYQEQEHKIHEFFEFTDITNFLQHNSSQKETG